MNYVTSAEEVIGIIPDKLLDELSLETGVDCFVKKLKGKDVFKLFLYALLSGKQISLRILEAIFNSEKFRRLFNVNGRKIKHSGIGNRLANIDYHYFENIFNYLISSKKVDEVCFAGKKTNIRKIDSTIVTLSSKLLKCGMKDNGKAAVKYSVEINGGIPVNIMLFNSPRYMCEDNALPEVIRKKSIRKGLNIAIFDRGIQRKETFIEFAKSKTYFISRPTCHKYCVVSESSLKETDTPTLEIISDQIVKFKNEEEMLDQEFRLVVGKNKETGKNLSFITNVDFLNAIEITELYRSRWEIETFFKFLKQEMNFSHLVSRSENGIKVVMYITMIAAILLTLYKKSNKIMGWAVAKIKFLDELEGKLLFDWHKEITPVFYHNYHPILPKIRTG